MPSSYTSNLRLTLPVQGELSGTWGDTVNTGITSLTDSAIAGTAAVTMTDADYTLTVSNGAADQARAMFITLTGTLTAARNVIVPSNSKLYYVTNSTTGGFAVTVKTSAGTGISISNGYRADLYCNGTSVYDAATVFKGTLQAYTERVTTSSATGATNIDLSLSNIFDVTLTGNATFTFTNPPASGSLKSVTVILRQDATGSRTATFTNAKYTDGQLPVLSTGANQIDVLTFFTVNGGSFWFGTFAMANVS